MSQGQYTILTKTKPKEPTTVKDSKTGFVALEHITVDEDVVDAKHEEWEEKIEKLTETNLKALGNIQLRLHHSIAYKYKEEKSAGSLWLALKAAYGKTGISAIYSEFKQAMDLRIPDNADPSLQIDKFTTHFGRLSEQRVEIEDHVQGMILLAKLPPSMDFLAHLICQEAEITDLLVAKIRKSMLLNWEQRSSGKQPPHQQPAQKISAIKRGLKEPPFQQQQQQEGSGRGRRNRQGNQAGRGRNPQAQPLQQEDEPAPSPGPSQPFTFGHGFIVSPAFVPPPPRPSLPPWYPPQNQQATYPSFLVAHNLAKRLGVIPSTKTVKCLEIPELTRDPRPLKKACKAPVDEEIVDIWGSDLEEDVVPQEEPVAEPSGTTQRCHDISELISQFTDHHVAIEDMKTNSPPSFTTSVQKGRRELNSLPCILATETNYNSMPSSSGDEKLTEAKWMLNSGASNHFTGEINDFVEYEAFTSPILVQTATTTSRIEGAGTVILQVKNELIRIYPVLYILELHSRLFSLGQFHQAGLHSRGSAKELSVYKGEDKFLSFHPRHKKGTIYVLQSLLGTKVDSKIKTVYLVDFETMHRRLAHPSKDGRDATGWEISQGFP